MKILFIGDVVGEPGRIAVREALAQWKPRYRPDAVIANAENSAGGMGATPKTLDELLQAGVDAFTMGDHVKDQPFDRLLDYPIVRPANNTAVQEGVHCRIIETMAGKLFLINTLGYAFMKTSAGDYFAVLDQTLETDEAQAADAILVDFHAEATSEKQAVGHYLDGRVSAVVGTHTHVPTADTKLLPKGTAFQADVGMSGAWQSVLGWHPESSLAWLSKELGVQRPYRDEPLLRDRPYICDAVLIDTVSAQAANSIVRVTTRPSQDSDN